jgi:hypothetical protein
MKKNSVVLTVIVVLVLIVAALGILLYWDDLFGAEGRKETKQEIDQNEAPIAKLIVSATTVHVDDIITFDGNTSEDPDGEIDFYIWDFGDGNRMESPNASYVEHSYSYGGDYLVNFTVQDNDESPKRNSTHVSIHVIPRNHADSGTMWVIAQQEAYNNESVSFPVEDEAIKVNISLTLRGVKIEGGVEAAEFEIFVYNPYSALMDYEEITVTGQDTVTFDFDKNDLKVSGDYTLEVSCGSGVGLINYDIEVLYQ